jgi:ribosomal protein S21
MGAKITVRQGEKIEQAFKRFRRAVEKARSFEKWPKSREFHATPSVIRRRKRWIQKLKLLRQRNGNPTQSKK